MSIKIDDVRRASKDEWDYICSGCSYTTYFHTREWAEIWKKYTRGRMRPDPKLVTFSDGCKALLPLSSSFSCRRLCKCYYSSPAGTYGGWLSLDDLTGEHAQVLADYMCSEFKCLTWRLNPFDDLTSSIRVNNLAHDVTHVIDLSSGLEGVNELFTKKKIMRKIRKAKKKGLYIKKASTLEEWKDYYKVYEASLKRWGEKATSFYKWRLFKNMFALKSPYIELWLVMLDDKVVNGTLFFYTRHHAVSWHGAGLKSYFKLYPVNLLYYEVLTDACKRGYKLFDLNPSGGHEGVKKFKNSHGAVEIPAGIVNNNP